MIKVSIIVPIYNTENYLNTCIKNLINQTLKEIEIILIDDGSTDNSGKICDEYAKKDKRIKVIHKKNEGAALARNVGIEIAQGEYIAFVDSDDYTDFDYYEKLYKGSDNNIDVVFGEIKASNSINRILSTNKQQKEDIVSRERKYNKNIIWSCRSKCRQKIQNWIYCM